MAKVYEFPRKQESNWREAWTLLQERYGNGVRALEALEACKSQIRHHWDETWYSFAVSTTMPAAREMTPRVVELMQAFGDAVSAEIGQEIEKQRVRLFLALADLEFRLAHVLRFGKEPES